VRQSLVVMPYMAPDPQNVLPKLNPKLEKVPPRRALGGTTMLFNGLNRTHCRKKAPAGPGL
jgi:hypothetical protein